MYVRGIKTTIVLSHYLNEQAYTAVATEKHSYSVYLRHGSPRS